MAEPKSRWGSLLSGAVAGLESRLDTILADDDQASARSRNADEVLKKAKLETLKSDPDSSRPSSKNRTNDRLQARLAKAIARNAESPTPGSNSPPTTISPQSQSPALAATNLPRMSIDSQLDSRLDSSPQQAETKDGAQNDAGTSKSTATHANIAAVRPSSDLSRESVDVVLPTETSMDTSVTAVDIDPDVAQKLKNQAEEIHTQLEKIDRLHANIAYLSSQLYENASAAASQAKDGSEESKEADKNKKIAQLLQEGGDLSKKEEKLRADGKYLRTRIQEEKKLNVETSKRLEKAENDIRDLRISIQSSETREKSANDRISSLSTAEKELAAIKSEKAEAVNEAQRLRKLLDESERRLDDADKQAHSSKLEEQMRVIAELNDELSNSRIEKRLVEDRVKTEMKAVKEEYTRQLEQSKIAEIEQKAEIQNLEAKLEVLRLRTEEHSVNTDNDSQAKLLRQIETLQTQYSIASDNWQGIEGGLNTRITTLEKERDELAKREAEARKKARDINLKAKRLEEDLEIANEANASHESEMYQVKAALSKLETRLSSAEKETIAARADLERERKEFEASMQTRIDEERAKWRADIGSGPTTPALDSPHSAMLRADSSFSMNHRKFSATDMSGSLRRSHGGRGHPADLSVLLPNYSPDHTRPSGRRGFSSFSGLVRTPTDPSLASRPESALAISPPPHLNGHSIPPPIIPVADDLPTPSIYTTDIDDMDTLRSSPQRTAAEMISVSTAGAGPSVQLVERMSATVRRLETEKAANREEIARLIGQRDEARNEVVALMREIESVKETQARVGKMENEMVDLKSRYEAALEMIGEKSEECEELKNDVQDLKKIYRELVESTLK